VKTVRMKLNTIRSEFRGKRVLLVDDSIVRGTTSRELVLMARDAGALKVYITSAAPPVKYANVYGIDIPTQGELIAYERDEKQVAAALCADWVLFQGLQGLKESIQRVNPALREFESSCFDGVYVTPGVTKAYLDKLQQSRNDEARFGEGDENGADSVPTSTCSSPGSDNGNVSPRHVNGGVPAEQDVACEGLFNAT